MLRQRVCRLGPSLMPRSARRRRARGAMRYAAGCKVASITSRSMPSAIGALLRPRQNNSVADRGCCAGRLILRRRTRRARRGRYPCGMGQALVSETRRPRHVTGYDCAEEIFACSDTMGLWRRLRTGYLTSTRCEENLFWVRGGASR